MLNSGYLLTLAALSLLSLGQPLSSENKRAPIQTAMTTSPASPAGPTLIAFAPEEQADPVASIDEAIRAIRANKDLSEPEKERLVAGLEKAKAALAGRLGTLRALDGDAKKDVRIRVRSKDGKLYELNNPTEQELREFREKIRKEVGDMNFDFKFDEKMLEKLQKEFDGKVFQFKFDPKEMEKFRKEFDGKVFQFKMDPKAREELRNKLKLDLKEFESDRRSSNALEKDIQRELEQIRRQRAELDAREKALRERASRQKRPNTI